MLVYKDNIGLAHINSSHLQFWTDSETKSLCSSQAWKVLRNKILIKS